VETRCGSGTKVVHYDESISQTTSSIYNVSVRTSDGYIHHEDNIDGESWTFSNEKDLTGSWVIDESGQYVLFQGTLHLS